MLKQLQIHACTFTDFRFYHRHILFMEKKNRNDLGKKNIQTYKQINKRKKKNRKHVK